MKTFRSGYGVYFISGRDVQFLVEGRLPTYILGEKRTRRFRKADLDKVPRLRDEPRKDDTEVDW